jgi:hypothetical protein
MKGSVYQRGPNRWIAEAERRGYLRVDCSTTTEENSR